MALRELAPADLAIIEAVIRFIESEPDLEHEYEVRLGVSRVELAGILERWPNVDDADDSGAVTLAVNNCLNEVLHGVHISETRWASAFPFSRADARTTYVTWAKLRGWKHRGLR